ncbi:ectonucleotide pyrophosphatase/phosphodiesterase family member 5-like [Clytia hemisphaerica]|eukprot:TCONS_00019176-protein
MPELLKQFYIYCMIFTIHRGAEAGKNKVFLLVLDGLVYNFRDFTSNLTNFKYIAENGVSAERMVPPFPSDTWPTMTTLNTGLYTESHGILKNRMFDEKRNLTFDYNQDNFLSYYGRFYSKEPFWLTNQKQGGNSSVYRWPGHLAFDEKPKYHENESHINAQHFTDARKAIDETFANLEKDSSLNFMVVYVDQPDPIGHKYGVNSTEYRNTIQRLDSEVVGYIKEKLKPHPNVDFIVVADHGMADLTDNVTTVLYMDDWLKKDAYILKGFEMVSPTQNFTVDDLWRNLTKLNDTGMAEIYRQNDSTYDFPSRLHYKHDPRISPILVLPKPNWRIAKGRSKNLTFTIGQHGYDVKFKEMSTIFFAMGPSFKKNITMDPFESVNLVPLMANILGVEAQPNNGTVNTFKNVLTPRVKHQTRNDERLKAKDRTKPIVGPDGLTEFTRFIYY